VPRTAGLTGTGVEVERPMLVAICTMLAVAALLRAAAALIIRDW
jgi:hypothetical protein